MYVLHNAQTHFYTIITSLYTNTDVGILSMLTNTTQANHYVGVSGSRHIPNLLALFLSLSLFLKDTNDVALLFRHIITPCRCHTITAIHLNDLTTSIVLKDIDNAAACESPGSYVLYMYVLHNAQTHFLTTITSLLTLIFCQC